MLRATRRKENTDLVMVQLSADRYLWPASFGIEDDYERCPLRLGMDSQLLVRRLQIISSTKDILVASPKQLERHCCDNIGCMRFWSLV